MADSVTFVLLIRHGENDWVGTNRLAGRTSGVHLNEKGRQQATALATQLSRQPLAAIYSSPLERCLETATPVAEAAGLSVIADEDVLEVDYGEWQGGDLKELAKLPDWHLVQHYPSSFRFPGGETLREVQSRAVAAVERLCQRHPNQVVAIFSHGDVIRTTVAHYMGTPLDLFQRVVISTAAVSAVAFHNGRPAVLFVNHLAELPVLEVKKDGEPNEAQPAVTGSSATGHGEGRDS